MLACTLLTTIWQLLAAAAMPRCPTCCCTPRVLLPCADPQPAGRACAAGCAARRPRHLPLQHGRAGGEEARSAGAECAVCSVSAVRAQLCGLQAAAAWRWHVLRCPAPSWLQRRVFPSRRPLSSRPAATHLEPPARLYFVPCSAARMGTSRSTQWALETTSSPTPWAAAT